MQISMHIKPSFQPFFPTSAPLNILEKRETPFDIKFIKKSLNSCVQMPVTLPNRSKLLS
jgi:hypothetical protein